MSRVGRKAIPIPVGVRVEMEGALVRVAGPKGELSHRLPTGISVQNEGGFLLVSRSSDARALRALHGLTRTLIANMVTGVDKGYERGLELVGTGYRAAKNGTKLVLTVGLSHQVEIAAPAGIDFEVTAPGALSVRGIDKQQVGQVAARIRSVRPPEPYLGKGIRYAGERVRRKVGKRGK